MKVQIIEEHPERERVALLFLADALRNAGHVPVLSNTHAIERDYLQHKPDIVLDNISDSVGHYMGKLSMLGPRQRNVNLIWEQITNPLSLFRFRFDEELSTRLVDGRVAWGEAFRETMLMENPWIDAARIPAVGSIKHAVLQFYSEVDQDALLALCPKDYAKYEKRVLLVDSFPAVRRDAEELRAMKGQRPFPYGFEALSYLLALREKTFAFFEEACRRHPDWLFILRMHPNKYTDYEKEFTRFRALPNLQLNGAGDIGPLLRICDLAVAARSGVLMDAFFAGTPAVNLAVEEHPSRLSGIMQTVEEQFATTVDLSGGVPEALDLSGFLNAAAPPEVERLAGKWVASAGKETFGNVVRFLEETLARPAVEKTVPRRRYANRFVASRWTKHQLRLRGLSDGRPPTSDHGYPYDRVHTLLRRGAGMP